MELISAVANLYGRYNFSKSFLTSGIFGLVNGILFFWVIRLINEMLTIAARIYKTPDRKTLYIDFEKVGKKVPSVFYYLACDRLVYFIWTELLISSGRLRGSSPITLRKERTIGESTFTIQSVFVFFLILILSGIISSIVTFLLRVNRVL
mgnify:CR=1 FL=1